MTYHICNNPVIETITTEKPWGHEILWAKNIERGYVSKILHINCGQKTSKQFHKEKDETIYVSDGILTLIISEKDTECFYYLKKGTSFHIKPNVIHRFYAEFTDVDLIETSSTELDDVVRLEDAYGRC